MEVEPVQERVIKKVKLFDDKVQYEQNTMNITIRIRRIKQKSNWDKPNKKSNRSKLQAQKQRPKGMSMSD